MTQPDIYLLGIRIQEPITILTNILVTFFCFYAIRGLNKKEIKGRSVFFLKLFFLGLGISTLMGGIIGHGFQYIYGLEGKLWGWIPSMIAVYFFECSSIEFLSIYFGKKQLRLLHQINFVIMTTFIFLTIYSLNFKYVVAYSFYGFFIVVSQIHLICWIKYKNECSKNILLGVGTLLCAMLVFIVQFIPHIWFNQNDMSHVLMVLACWWFLKAGLKMEDLQLKTNHNKEFLYKKKE